MSEAEALREEGPKEVAEEMPQPVFETRQPFDLSDELRARVAELDLVDSVEHVKEHGYGYVHDAAPPEFVARLRETIIRIAHSKEAESVLARLGASMLLPMLLTKDPIFAEVVVNPKLLTMVEILCGKGAMLSQVAATIKPGATEPGDGKGGLHADQNWTPAPFPVHNQLVTFCWACDEFNEAAGSTRVVPGSHRERRHPNQQEVAEEPGVIHTACPAGSIVFWDGSTWHSGGAPRTVEGERVVLHISYSRMAMRPVECYDFLGEDWLADKPWEMRVLLGREDFLNTPQGGFAHGIKLPRAMNWAKT